MKICFLTENKTEHEGILAEHGLSLYIETGGKKILFDSGATDTFAHNAEKMNIDLSAVDFAMVSHGHYDHTGGFPLFMKINDKAPLYLHRNAMRKSHGTENGRIEKNHCGIRWSEEEFSSMEKRIVRTDGPVKITNDIIITGTVPKAEGFVPSERFYYRDESGEFVEDDMSHEQCLVIRENGGLYIFSGCCHRGAVSSLKAGQRMFPGMPVKLFAAGMHLYGADEETRKAVIDTMQKEAVEKIMPVHCTGIRAICEMKERWKDRCVIAVAGDVFDERV